MPPKAAAPIGKPFKTKQLADPDSVEGVNKAIADGAVTIGEAMTAKGAVGLLPQK